MKYGFKENQEKEEKLACYLQQYMIVNLIVKQASEHTLETLPRLNMLVRRLSRLG